MTVWYAVPQTHFIYKWYRKLFIVDFHIFYVAGI